METRKLASDFKKGDYMVIQNRPCKVKKINEMTETKNEYVGTDVFDDTKELREEISVSTWCQEPDVTDDSYKLKELVSKNEPIRLVSVMDEEKILPAPSNIDIYHRMKTLYKQEKSVEVIVRTSMGEEKIICVNNLRKTYF